jgi:UDP-N-acetylglucosamine--N-acetylmuramyl-(pentapeptide) pyrophosphoryl-undecaprenol N-acetylglucosamine transferase
MTDTIVLTGGGTAGHIYPALALAQKLQERGFSVVYAGVDGRVEARLVPHAGLEFKSFNVTGFDRSKPWTGVTALLRLKKAEKEACEWLKKNDPKVVVGFGGYVSVPVTHTANKLGIKTAIHEQNSHMGIANRELSKVVDRVCLTYEIAGEVVSDKSKIVVTGNPVRPAVMEAKPEDGFKYLQIDDNQAFVLLIFGGSLGAKSINEAASKLKSEILKTNEHLYVVHITGKRDYETIKEELKLTEEEQQRWKLIDYCDKMPSVLACTDAIISRAGATSLAEISALKIPSILSPFPYATADHQTKNAREYVDAGAAYMIADDRLETPEFRSLVLDLIKNEDTRKRMREAASSFGSVDAAENLCKVVVELLER